jgi:polysaccharide export outer membrane protein
MPVGAILTFIVLISGAGLSAQTIAPSNPPQQNLVQYRLGAGDQVRIWVLGLEEFFNDKPHRVEPGGDLNLPLAGKIHAAGMTVDDLKAFLVERLVKEVLRPEVSIEITEFGSEPVSILGAVNHPGVHQLQGRKTLVEVISLADGMKDNAGPRITISRQIENGPIPLLNARTDPSGKFSVAEVEAKGLLTGAHPAENILICPNDVVTVPPAESVFVIGEVHKPGEVPMRDSDTLTVLQALSRAEGFGPTPAPHHSRIIRFIPGAKERQEIPVDLNKMLAGKAEDLPLRANDILVIPPNTARKVAVRALEAAVQTAVGMAIWRIP